MLTDANIFDCSDYTSSALYAYSNGYDASYNGILNLGEDEVTLNFLETNSGLFLFLILDRPAASAAINENLQVTATTLLANTQFTNDGFIKDDGSEVSISSNGQSVVGNFHWNHCCTDGFAVSGFSNASKEFDIQITFKKYQSGGTITKISIETIDHGRTTLKDGLDFQSGHSDIVTIGFRGKLP